MTKDPTRSRAAKAAPRCITCGNIVAIRCRLTGSQACAGDKKSDAFAPSRRLLPAGGWVAFCRGGGKPGWVHQIGRGAGRDRGGWVWGAQESEQETVWGGGVSR